MTDMFQYITGNDGSDMGEDVNLSECPGCGTHGVMLIHCPNCGALKCKECDMGDDVECLNCDDIR